MHFAHGILRDDNMALANETKRTGSLAFDKFGFTRILEWLTSSAIP